MENDKKTIWEVLGIEPTKNEKEITSAYRERLSATNPEDKPEEFKELRTAYEEALEYAKLPDELQGENKDVDEWLKQLQDVYDDFSKRREVDCWEELFSKEICESVSGHMRIEEELLHFLMDHYFIGHDVWLCMDRHFSFLERKEELYERYPREFIDRIIVNGTLYQDILPMMLFVPGKDAEECGRYLDTYLDIRMEEDCRDKIEVLEGMKESHPYGDALICSWKTRFEDPKYLEELEKIAERYEDDLNIAMMLGRTYCGIGAYEKAEALCEKQMEQHKDKAILRNLYADVLEAQEKYDEAMTQINVMMSMADGDNRRLSELNERRKKINPFIISRKKEILKENPNDTQAKIDLFWAYLENERNEEAKELFDTVDKEKTPAFDYYNMMATLTYDSKDYEKGIEALEKLIEAIDELPEDSEKNISRKKRKGEMYGRMAYFYQMLGNENASMKANEKALEVSENKAETLVSMTQMSFMKEDYEKAQEYAERLIREKPDSVYGHNLLAYAYFYRHNDQEAYNTISRAIEMDGSDLGFFILKTRILIRNDAFEEAQDIIEYLDSCGLQENASVLYVKGLLHERRDNDKEKAKECFNQALQNMEGLENNYEFTDDLYYRILCIEGESLDGNVKEDRDRMMELCEKGLSCRPSNKDLLEYKGWLLMKARDYEKSLKIYLDLEKDENHTGYIDSQIGYLYYQDLEHKAKESRDHYLKALEKGYDSGAHFYIGMCEMFMGHLDEAEHQFLVLKEKEPNTIDPYLRLSSVYEMKDDLDKALDNVNSLLEIVKDRKDDVSRYYLKKVQILRRRREPEAAIEVLKQIAKKYKYPAKKRIFDIYMQFGMYKEAEKELWGWKWDGDYYDALTSLSIMKGNFKKARQIMDSHGGSIDDVRRLILQHLLAMEEEDFEKEEKYLNEWLKPEEGKYEVDLSQVAGHLSYCAFHQKDEEKQHRYAQMAMEDLEKQLQSYSLDMTLFQTRKYRLLTLLGRRKEAEELAEKIRRMPKCSFCSYCGCKDLDAFEMEAAEIFGDEEKALALAKQGNERWPDEEDFIVTLSRLNRKVKKEC